MHIYAIILAAGSGSRFLTETQCTPKQFFEYVDAPVFLHSARTFSCLAEVRGLLFVFPPNASYGCATKEEYRELVEKLTASMPLGVTWDVTFGGATRQESVQNGLNALPSSCDGVLIHDSARPFMTATLASRIAQELINGTQAVIPAIPVTDTIKAIDAMGIVTNTPIRSTLRAVQTPQGFHTEIIKKAHAFARDKGFEGTDDAQLIEFMGEHVLVIEGEKSNKKITNPEDVALLEKKDNATYIPCTGFGYDVHKYGGTRAFILGGVPINTDITVSAHSDGDTLLHALMDAMLGLIGGGDIGGMFPDTDASYEGISSGILLSEVSDRVLHAGVTLCHLDITIIAQVPRIAPHSKAIAKNIASLLQLPLTSVNVKATTEEHLGFTGEKKGIKVACVVTGMKKVE